MKSDMGNSDGQGTPLQTPKTEATIVMGKFTFFDGVASKGKSLLMTVNNPTDRAKVVNSNFDVKSMRIVGEHVGFQACMFTGEVRLESGAMLFGCYIDGDVYADSMRQLTGCHITGKFIKSCEREPLMVENGI